MSDPIAKATTTAKARFLSLKWKSVATLLSILIVLLSLLAWHFYEQFQRNYQARLATLRLQQLEELEKTVYRSGEILHRLIASIVIQDSPTTPNSSTSNLDQYGERMREVLPKVWQQWQMEEAILVSTHDNLIEQMPGNPDKAQPLVSWLTEVGAARLPANSINILCLPNCLQVLNFPILDGNARVGNLVISRDINTLKQQLYNQTGTELFLFANSPIDEIQNTSKFLTSNSHHIPSWHGQLVSTVENEQLIEALHVASKHFSPAVLFTSSQSFSHDGRTYAVSFLPIRGYEDLSLRYLLLSDISNEHKALVDGMFQDALILFFLVATFTIYMVISSWRNFGRVKQQIDVLPLLSQNQFSEARDIVHKNRRHNLFRDELDTLDDTVIDFSYQLESLEKAVNVRTREMERLSLFDTLTGLANRNLLQYELQSDVHRFVQQGGVLAIVILDLDKFKRINDSVGHQLGDMLLGKIAARLKNATRSLGLVARLGGDEFAIILRSAKKVAQVEVLCQKIIELIRRPLELDNHSISISCSLGVALAGNQQSGTDMIKNAEIAMYKAKESGGNAYRVFNPHMATEAHANLSLEADIRRAFENKEFTLFLQPKVNMESHIMGFEALIRWDHPDRGLVPPVEFIPAMENMGLISHLDNFVLDASCRQLKVLQTHYPEISIAVNISSTHFTDKNFLVFLKACLNKYPIDPSRLELEITETLLMENMSVGLEIIEQIKELGVSIAIDDFGTGYSSLSYLKKLPVDTIKIDREFIKDIPESESDMQISSVIIFLAKQLNFTVVAEGVETSEQLVFLKANQCDLAQGYLFSKPIPAHKAMILLESQIGGKKLGIA